MMPLKKGAIGSLFVCLNGSILGDFGRWTDTRADNLDGHFEKLGRTGFSPLRCK